MIWCISEHKCVSPESWSYDRDSGLKVVWLVTYILTTRGLVHRHCMGIVLYLHRTHYKEPYAEELRTGNNIHEPWTQCSISRISHFPFNSTKLEPNQHKIDSKKDIIYGCSLTALHEKMQKKQTQKKKSLFSIDCRAFLNPLKVWFICIFSGYS